MGQAAQGGVMLQLGLFFDRQSDFQPYFFVVGTQNNSSILSDFRRGRGYSGVSPGNGFCTLGGEIRCSLSPWTGIVLLLLGMGSGRGRLLSEEVC